MVLVARSDGLVAADVRPWYDFRCKSLPRKMAIANKAQQAEEDASTMLISPMMYCGITPRKQCTRLSSIWLQNPRLPVP